MDPVATRAAQARARLDLFASLLGADAGRAAVRTGVVHNDVSDRETVSPPSFGGSYRETVNSSLFFRSKRNAVRIPVTFGRSTSLQRAKR